MLGGGPVPVGGPVYCGVFLWWGACQGFRCSGVGVCVGRLEVPVDCWMFFGQCLFVLQAAFVKSRKSLSTSSGVRYPRAE